MANVRTAPTRINRIGERASVGDVAQFPGVISTFMGRDALTLAVAYLNLTADDTVVLPVYTCPDVLRSFLRKCHVVFYDIGRDLTIDPDRVRAALHGNDRVKIVLITNYFGFLQPYRNEIQEVCAQREICLIEDCAHSLLTQGSGETGDLAVYSFRKILPVRDGGGLVVNRELRQPVPRYHCRFCSDVLSFLAFAKGMLPIHTQKFSRAQVASYSTGILPLPAKDDRILPLSSFAHRSIGNISLAEVTEKRRADFQFWQELTVGNSSLVPMFAALPQGVCPFGFALRTKQRDSLEARARANGIHLRVHWRLEPSLARECSISHELSKEMVTLPLYPELKPREREILAGIITGL